MSFGIESTRVVGGTKTRCGCGRTPLGTALGPMALPPPDGPRSNRGAIRCTGVVSGGGVPGEGRLQRINSTIARMWRASEVACGLGAICTEDARRSPAPK
jgi:hypothetical protein